MSLLLNIPFSDKNKAKILGAKWNVKYRKWFVEKRSDYPRFIKWILRNENYTSIVCDFIYVAEGKIKCPNCEKETNVITFGIENYFEIIDYFDYYGFPYKFHKGTIFFSPMLDPIPDELKKFIKNRVNLNCSSKALDDGMIINHCIHCNAQLDDGVDLLSIFSCSSITREILFEKLNIYKILLKYDLISDIYLFENKDEFCNKSYFKIIETGLEV